MKNIRMTKGFNYGKNTDVYSIDGPEDEISRLLSYAVIGATEAHRRATEELSVTVPQGDGTFPFATDAREIEERCRQRAADVTMILTLSNLYHEGTISQQGKGEDRK